jgi:sulfate adenylyltransferase
MIDLSRDGRWSDTTHDAIQPHGGRLVRRLLDPEEAEATRAAAERLPRVELSPRILADLDMIGIGALSPLTGFMTREELASVVDVMRLPDGTVMSLPVVLPVLPAFGSKLRAGDQLALGDEEGGLHGILEVRDAGPVDYEAIAARAFGTRDPAHPGVAALLAQPAWIVGGPVVLFDRPRMYGFASHDLEPRATRAAFRARGWKTIVAFQTRNPIHRAHEYIQKVALEIVDGLLVHPLVGETKRDDIPAEVRMRCYEVLLDHYYPRDRVMLAVLPAAMRYAGPREAVFHAILRRNYGCTHFIVGRDHAGVGNYYGTYDAQELLRSFPQEEIGITPLCFENSFFCTKCGNMASRKTCPHPPEAHLSLSGTKVREMLRAGDSPPPEFTRQEVARVLMRLYVDPASGI